MKQAALILALLLAGCASQPTTAPVTAGSLAPASQEEEVRLAVQEAVEKGYKVVTDDGQTLYCRKDLKTGSRVQSNLTCLTEDQLADAAARRDRLRQQYPEGQSADDQLTRGRGRSVQRRDLPRAAGRWTWSGLVNDVARADHRDSFALGDVP